MTMRAWTLRLHRWIGLALFALLTLQCASGVLIQFRPAIERFIAPQVMRASVPGVALALDVQAARALELPFGHATARDAGYVVARVTPGAPAEAVSVLRLKSPSAAPREIEVFVDPVSADLRGWRDGHARGLDRMHLMQTLEELHTNLLCGDAGQILLALLAVLWLPLAAAGVFITLPKRFKWAQWQRMWSIRRADTDLHRASGLWLSVFSVVLAVTTVLMVFDDEIFGDLRYRAQAGTSAPIGLDAAALRALAVLGGEAAQYELRVVRDEPRDGRYRVDLQHRARGLWQRPDERVYLAAGDGAVIGREGWLSSTLGQRLRALSLPAHTGEIFGLAGQWLFVALALVLAMHLIYGFRGWLRRRHARMLRTAQIAG